MPVDVQVIRCADFVRTKATGELDFEESMKVLREVVSAVSPASVCRVLVDVRDARPRLAIGELFDLGACFAAQEHSRFTRTALLTTEGDRFADAYFIESVTVNRGARMKAFTDFEQAMSWLLFDEDEKTGAD